MDWMTWGLLIVATLAVGSVIYMNMKGYLNKDAAVLCVASVVELVRKAESLWKNYQGAGARKKIWVLDQLEQMGIKFDNTTMGTLIDALVAWLNATGWK